jgi:hypothetical protein
MQLVADRFQWIDPRRALPKSQNASPALSRDTRVELVTLRAYPLAGI